MNSNPSHPLGTIGRLLRLSLGIILLVSIAPFYASSGWTFGAASAGVAVALAILYALVHFFVTKYLQELSPWLGAILAFLPLVLVYWLGTGGGPIFGSGEGQLGALTYLSLSLVTAGWRGDPGCEVMTLPNLWFRKNAHLACLFFSPLDWLERKIRNRRFRQS